TDFGENVDEDRKLSHCLYGGDETYRLAQEALLGLGGIAWLKSLGRLPHAQDEKAGSQFVFHMNEGHSALLTLGLLKERVGADLSKVNESAIEWVRSQTVFTTHTPVPAGHDTFPLALARQIIGEAEMKVLEGLEVCEG